MSCDILYVVNRYMTYIMVNNFWLLFIRFSRFIVKRMVNMLVLRNLWTPGCILC